LEYLFLLDKKHQFRSFSGVINISTFAITVGFVSLQDLINSNFFLSALFRLQLSNTALIMKENSFSSL